MLKKLLTSTKTNKRQVSGALSSPVKADYYKEVAHLDTDSIVLEELTDEELTLARSVFQQRKEASRSD